MKYIIILLMFIGLVGCGGGSADDKKAPASPQTQDKPPSVPNI
jgi:hypothetical protein